MVKEVQRVLKTGGIYIIISYGSPENRIFHLVREKFKFKKRDHISFDIECFVLCSKRNDIEYGKDMQTVKKLIDFQGALLLHMCKAKWS